MPTLVVVGAQWGDEAKGKLVDVLAGEADYVVRFSGGNNAGHTVIVGEDVFKFSLLPAGILSPHVVSILGSGMVIDPKSLLQELDRTKSLRPELGILKISASAHVVFPYHLHLDRLQEEARGENKIGTTSRGIGPAYEDKVARIGIRFGEFTCRERFPTRLKEVLHVKNELLKLFGQPEIPFAPLLEEYESYARLLEPMVCETEPLLQQAFRAKKKVLFEGAQGTFLDLDSGTYPYVTSSHPVAGGACIGTGLGPRHLQHVLGVCKAYTTRVGSGPFPTELEDAIGEQIRSQGNEFGTITGRGRRCGWLDLVALKQACWLNSLSSLALTRIDVLRNISPVKLCVGYRLNNGSMEHVPSDIRDIAKIEPVYEQFEGWDADLCDVEKWEDLPKSTQRYLQCIEDLVQTPISLLSVGPEREQTIRLKPELLWV